MQLAVVQGGADHVVEPDWTLIYADELEQQYAREMWHLVVAELKGTEKLAPVNAPQIEGYVMQLVTRRRAARMLAEQGEVIKAKRTSVPQYNPWFTIQQSADEKCARAEAELTLSPRRRNHGGKVPRKAKRASASDAYLTTVPK